ncbi:MAG: nucleoside monophosphate kinase [Candidatus Levybacteria bacterium]|nr:nucleoside monophosphate kinase [Candidatus Levybacteria bacterium]
MIIVFIGPPYAGKDTQGKLLSHKFGNIPIFSMGHLIREARESGNKTFIKAYDEYSLRGLHLPTVIKFPLLKEKMDQAKTEFILDNFPATKDDLEILNDYLSKTNKKINKVVYLYISEEEMMRRFKNAFRGRKDDDPDIVAARREIQGQDRIPVLEFYKNQNLLAEINGEGDINEIYKEISKELQGSNQYD